MFLSKIFLKQYTNYFNIILIIIFLKKCGGEAPLLPAGPRLISSDSKISA